MNLSSAVMNQLRGLLAVKYNLIKTAVKNTERYIIKIQNFIVDYIL